MKTLVKFVAPVALVFAAMGAQAAGTVETDYPMNATGRASAAGTAGSGDVHLLQSDHEGPRELAGPRSGDRSSMRGTSGAAPDSAPQKRTIDPGYFA